MSTSQLPDNEHQLEEAQKEIDEAKAASDVRSKKVVDVTARLRELRRQNHFRLMLEDVFNN